MEEIFAPVEVYTLQRIEVLRVHLSKDELKKAIQMNPCANTDLLEVSEHRNEFITYSANFWRLERAWRIGVIEFKTYSQEKNGVIEKVLLTLDSMENKLKVAIEKKMLPCMIVLFIVVISFVIAFSNKQNNDKKYI